MASLLAREQEDDITLLALDRSATQKRKDRILVWGSGPADAKLSRLNKLGGKTS